MSTTSRQLVRSEHDAEVAARFDASEARFKSAVDGDDIRLKGVIRAIGPVAGLRILDLGCGKGRFATHLIHLGADVVGIDLSQAMLIHADHLGRAKASARRLPFADATFDAVIAVEVLEHVGDARPVLQEARRVLRPGGRLAVVDKNILAIDAQRPWLPSVLIKWIDQRRGLWMYPSDGSVQERWFLPRSLRTKIARTGFERSSVEHLLTRSESRRWLFRAVPAARLMTLWSAAVPIVPEVAARKGFA